MQTNTPAPLKEEALGLIQRAQKGSQSDFEELLERYAPLIDSMTARFCGAEMGVQDKEDLRQEAVLAFYRALLSYDCSQSEVRFGLYAKTCIQNRLISYLRSIKQHGQVVFLEDEGALPECEGGDDPAEQLAEEESYLALSRRIHDALSAYENRIWWLYLSGRTAKQIAAALGKDERSVQNAVYRIRRKLREVIPNSQQKPE